jgi:hypothetical protein
MSRHEKRPGHDEPVLVTGGLAALPPGRRTRVPAARGDRAEHPSRPRRARSAPEVDTPPPAAVAGGLADAFDEVGNGVAGATPDDGTQVDADVQRDPPAADQRDPSDRPGAHGYPAYDVVLEQLAHRFAYVESWGDDRIEDLLRLGYVPFPGFVGQDGLRALAVRPVAANPHRSPVLAFRGTAVVADILEDFNSAGIGANRFARHHAAI